LEQDALALLWNGLIAELSGIIPDQHILGSFFWSWDNAEDFNLHDLQAATVIHITKILQA